MLSLPLRPLRSNLEPCFSWDSGLGRATLHLDLKIVGSRFVATTKNVRSANDGGYVDIKEAIPLQIASPGDVGKFSFVFQVVNQGWFSESVVSTASLELKKALLSPNPIKSGEHREFKLNLTEGAGELCVGIIVDSPDDKLAPFLDQKGINHHENETSEWEVVPEAKTDEEIEIDFSAFVVRFNKNSRWSRSFIT